MRLLGLLAQVSALRLATAILASVLSGVAELGATVCVLESFRSGAVLCMPEFAGVYAPETKSLSDVAGLSGCAGVKFRQQEALCGDRRGLGDEGRGAVWEGPLRGSD